MQTAGIWLPSFRSQTRNPSSRGGAEQLIGSASADFELREQIVADYPRENFNEDIAKAF
jgi:hypothetical protein